MMDNSRWHKFNDKLYSLLKREPLFVMDLGCAGGGFVKDFLDDGHQAIGLEGSDYSLLRKRAEWATIPDNLFTCDITHPFQVSHGGEPAVFDVITAWEVMEHLPQECLPGLCENLRKHLVPGGMCVFSVSSQNGFHHVTVRNDRLWRELFDKHGFVNDQKVVDYFGQDMVRGPTTHGNAPNTFHLALKLK